MASPESQQSLTSPVLEKARPPKRPRVAVACQRCKRRKQRCDGLHPCRNCKDFQATCQYLPSKSMSLSRDQQRAIEASQAVQAVEDRVAELESILAREGIDVGGRKRRHVSSRDSSRPSPSPGVNQPKRWRSTSTRSEKQRSGGSPISPGRAAVSTVVEILRDLSIEASGGYIGASSQITMGRMISSIVQAKEHTVGSDSLGGWEHLSPKSANSAPVVPDAGLEFSQVPAEIADKLFNGYIRHISTRWPVLQTPFMRLLHAEREILTDTFFTSVLHLIYAIGGRFLETTGETGDFYPEQHYDQALVNMDNILRLHDIRSVQFLLLLSIYSLRSPRGPGAWTYSGLAMRQCIELGLHRKTQKRRSPLEHEMRKRVFWTCYCLDRQVSIILGRPFAISDRDIDVELPLDVDESTEDPEILEKAQETANRVPVVPTAKSTSMTGFIYICRLRIIESQIQQSVYRVDETSPATEAEIERFVQKLEEWKGLMPKDASNPEFPNVEAMVVDCYDTYIVYYYKCLRFLLHPIILSSEMSDTTRYLRKCAEACGGVCRTYKRLHQVMPVGFSVMALHSVFLAGLTLIFCVWASPKEVFGIGTSNDMNACSIVLYIITERWPGARKYRDTYETIKQRVLESVEEGGYEPRRAITNLRPGLQAALQSIEKNDDGHGEFSAMVSHMAGGPSTEVDEALVGDPVAHAVEGDTAHAGFNFPLPLDGMPLDFHQADAYNAMDMQIGTIFQTPNAEWLGC
ncbi:fungal-specific transcription factor domain-containing protein [Xylariaceae sp. FL0016]|nr:fungal-specific transcription factor domain-containing protein [Xylariaceae sp. FL0016]